MVSIEQENQMKQFVTNGKKVKLNWLLAVTQLSIDDLKVLAEKLGFIIKGEYIALPSEADTIRVSEHGKPPKLTPLKKPTIANSRISSNISSEALLSYRYCTSCGITLKDTGKAYYLTGFCPSCGEDLQTIFDEDKKNKEPYKKLNCNICGAINPKNVHYCFHCGSNSLSTIQ